MTEIFENHSARLWLLTNWLKSPLLHKPELARQCKGSKSPVLIHLHLRQQQEVTLPLPALALQAAPNCLGPLSF